MKKEGVSPLLFQTLIDIMSEPLFRCFRLVGGTNLALRYNHRISTDIDLFTDAEYGSLDFLVLEKWLRNKYPYFECTNKSDKVVMGRTYYIGDSKDNAIKLDLMYESEKFLFDEDTQDQVIYADVREIAVMKLDAIYYGGRKKDFWDLHFLIFDKGFDLDELIFLHSQRFVYQHNRNELIERLTDFTVADDEPDPQCKLGKDWDIIKLDIIDAVENLRDESH